MPGPIPVWRPCSMLQSLAGLSCHTHCIVRMWHLLTSMLNMTVKVSTVVFYLIINLIPLMPSVLTCVEWLYLRQLCRVIPRLWSAVAYTLPSNGSITVTHLQSCSKSHNRPWTYTYIGTLLSTLLHATYKFLHILLNVLAQTAIKWDYKTKQSCCQAMTCVVASF
jgi:hypothetical protein